MRIAGRVVFATNRYNAPHLHASQALSRPIRILCGLVNGDFAPAIFHLPLREVGRARSGGASEPGLRLVKLESLAGATFLVAPGSSAPG
ncbi:MAG: hypothetical protein WCQ21_07570 [Verrucomicrobiota bacterium]